VTITGVGGKTWKAGNWNILSPCIGTPAPPFTPEVGILQQGSLAVEGRTAIQECILKR
jgi:hypothetical protein